MRILKAFGALVMFAPLFVSAAIWSETSVSFLRGSNFANSYEDNNRSEMTFEHASANKYGDVFFWMEGTDVFSGTGSNNTKIYGEFSPRFSFGKTFGFADKDRLVQDVLLATTIEMGRSSVISRARLYGLGIDLKLPYFAFFQWNLYIRDTLEKTGTTFQSTLAYKVPINLGAKFKLAYQAYIDIIHGDEGTESDNNYIESFWHTGQQILMDVGHLWGATNVIHAGFEYQYWNRKFVC